VTKYILAGGNDLGFSGYGMSLAEEVYTTVNRPAKILSCFFADPEPWQGELRARDWIVWFRKCFGDETLYDYVRPDTMQSQMLATDVIYLHGGDNQTLVNRLISYPELSQWFEGKVVIGSSAGANFLAQHYWARSKQQVLKGAGILPRNVMVHYGTDDAGGPKTDWQSVEEELTMLDGGRPLLLREGQFQVIEQ
jgi:hypothetical protein